MSPPASGAGWRRAWAAVAIVRAVLAGYQREDVPALAAAMAYHLLLAVFPFLIFLVTVAAAAGRLVHQDRLADELLEVLSGHLPAAAAEAVRGPLEQVLGERAAPTQTLGAAVSLGLTLYSAAGGVNIVLRAFNRTYGVLEPRGFLHRQALAVGLTLAVSVLLLGGVAGLAFGAELAATLRARAGLIGPVPAGLLVAEAAAGVTGIALALSLLYWLGPAGRRPFRLLTPGVLLGTSGLAALPVGFGLYVDLVGAASRARVYGAAFGLVLFLFYLFLAGQVVLVGATVNAVTERRAER